MKIKAKVVPWSSIVGSGLMLLDEKGRCIAQLALMGVQLPGDNKEVSMKLIEQIAEKING